MVLILADRSLIKPRGFIEDVPIRVGPFEFPADFVVLDTHEKIAIFCYNVHSWLLLKL